LQDTGNTEKASDNNIHDLEWSTQGGGVPLRRQGPSKKKNTAVRTVRGNGVEEGAGGETCAKQVEGSDEKGAPAKGDKKKEEMSKGSHRGRKTNPQAEGAGAGHDTTGKQRKATKSVGMRKGRKARTRGRAEVGSHRRGPEKHGEGKGGALKKKRQRHERQT